MAYKRYAGPAALLSAVLLLGSAGPAAAQNQGTQILIGPEDNITRVGTRGANFLEIPVGARETALGGAGTALTTGVNAMYWNPGALALSESFGIGGSYTELFEGSGVSHFYGGAMLPVMGGVFGVSVNSLNSGEIDRATERVPSGDIRTLGSSFEWRSTAVGGYYARMITDRLGIGAGIKFIEEGINEASARWTALDVGIRFDTGIYGTVIGATVANVGGAANFEGSAITAILDDNERIFPTGRDIDGTYVTDELQLPTYLRFGLMVDLAGSATSILSTDPRHRVAALLDIRDAVDTSAQPTVAFEYSFNNILFLRGGKFWRNEFVSRDFDDGLSAGFGLNLPLGDRKIEFGFAQTSNGQLGTTRIFTINFES